MCHVNTTAKFWKGDKREQPRIWKLGGGGKIMLSFWRHEMKKNVLGRKNSTGKSTEVGKELGYERNREKASLDAAE